MASAAEEPPRPKPPPGIAAPGELAVEMARSLVAGDRKRFEALTASREEMLAMLKADRNPSADEMKEMEGKVDEIIADRTAHFDEFQALKKECGMEEGREARYELVDMDPVREKDGMKKVRHSRVRVRQVLDGKETSFLIGLDDMFLFKRGWAFTSVFITPHIEKEPPRK